MIFTRSFAVIREKVGGFEPWSTDSFDYLVKISTAFYQKNYSSLNASLLQATFPMSKEVDPLLKFEHQFQSFVRNNPNVASAAHSASQIPESAKAVVVLSPLSLQHQFPRYWVSKSYKKTIVERPERLLACSMGIGAAITMYPALFTLKSSHKRKTSLLSDHVLKVHGSDWPQELLKLCKTRRRHWTSARSRFRSLGTSATSTCPGRPSAPWRAQLARLRPAWTPYSTGLQSSRPATVHSWR